MIALTGRLNERDETIIQLQEELDAYDRINRDTEVYIEHKNYRIKELENFITQSCKREVPPDTNMPASAMGFQNNMDDEGVPRGGVGERKYAPHSEYGGGLGSSQNG